MADSETAVHQESRKQFWDKVAQWRRTNSLRRKTYARGIHRLIRALVPEGQRILEIGSGSGELLATTHPLRGVGVDLSPEMVRVAREKYPDLTFIEADATDLPLTEKFDYVILSDVVGVLDDVQGALDQLRKVSTPQTRIIITHYSKLWYPVVRLAEKLHLKTPSGVENWLSIGDLENLLRLSGCEVVAKGRRMLCLMAIPLIEPLLNRFVANLPGFNRLCFVQYVVARPSPAPVAAQGPVKVSVVIPTLNEAGNIEGAVQRTPDMGDHTEFIFVDGHSTDGTIEKIQEQIKKYPQKDIKLLFQDGKGKADAVFKGFDACTGDILMILDSDLTVPPEDLPRFYRALSSGVAELANGSRLVYPMESQAMRTLNYFANHTFGVLFSWLLGQYIKDTLCGTKALTRKAYQQIKQGRSFFGDFDPFGDFDLLFGASKLNLKITDIPIRYRERTYGDIKIHRFRHGWLLLKMCVFAARKIKFV